jgi:hypothetical protein
VPKTINEWTILGNAGDRRSRKCDGWGTLKHTDGGLIMFGTDSAIRGGVANACPVTTPCIIDLKKIEHGTDHDKKEVTIPCFIAASDLIHYQLNAYKKAYIHCNNGNSRTAFCLITYLIRHEKFTWDDASKLVTAGQEERTDINFKLRTQGTQGDYAEWLESKSGEISTGHIALSAYGAAHTQASATSHKHKAVYEVCTNRAEDHRRNVKRTLQSDEGSSMPSDDTSQATTATVAMPPVVTPPPRITPPSSAQKVVRKRRKNANDLMLAEGKAYIDWYEEYKKKRMGK